MSKVLIVDDEANVAKSIRRLLEARDFDVLVAEDGRSALELLRTESDVGVIVSDQRMPRMTGSELFSQLSVERPEPKRILLTGYTDLESIREAINKGNVFRFLLKPWDDEELIRCVEEGEHYYLVQTENRRLREELERTNQNLENLVQTKTRVLNMNIRSLERYEKIVEQVPVGIACISEDGMVVLANQEFGRLFALNTAAEGMPYRRVIPTAFHPLIENFEDGLQVMVEHDGQEFIVTSRSLEVENTIYGRLFSFQVNYG